MSTPGPTMSKARRSNTYETRTLVLKIHPGATTTLRRASWVMMKSGGRKLGYGKGFRPANETRATIMRQTTMHLEQEERVRWGVRRTVSNS
jgi:hypothetical protein